MASKTKISFVFGEPTLTIKAYRNFTHHIEHSRLFCICWSASKTSFTFTDMIYFGFGLKGREEVSKY